MTSLYGREARHTNDHKVLEDAHTLNITGLNLNWPTTNTGYSEECKFINCSGREILVLTADGLRLRSPIGPHVPNGKCYFLKSFRIGGHVTLELNPLLENDIVTRDQLIEIEQAIERQRTDPITGQRITTEVTVQFRYVVECIDIDQMEEGIWIPYLGVHLFKADFSNHHKVHYGRSRYAEVLMETAKSINDKGVPQAAGCAAVYTLRDRNNTIPVIVANQYYQGVLYPTYDPARPPGIYIVQTNERRTVENASVRNYVHIPVDKFAEHSVFRSREEFNAYIKDIDRKTQGKDLQTMLLRFAILAEGFELPPEPPGKDNTRGGAKPETHENSTLRDTFEWLNIIDSMQSKILSIMKAR